MTGDFVDHKLDHRPALEVMSRLFSQLPSRLGTYAITGNHDGDLLAARLPAMGIHFINRRFVRLESDQAAVELIGLPG